VPLVLLAIPSALIGWFTVKPMLFGDYFGGSIQVLPAHDVLGRSARNSWRPNAFIWHALIGAMARVARGRRRAHGLCVLLEEAGARGCGRALVSSGCTRILVNKYGFDWFNEHVIAPARAARARLWHYGDEVVIDGAAVNGSARLVGWFSLGDALCAVRLSLSLRVRDDPRTGLAAAVAPLANLMFGGHLLSVLIWLPIVGGFVVLGLGNRADGPRAGPRCWSLAR
jgi:NADH:ubiquinone oxidoreductase subunit 5 (subunit L)/multisubunit Na+/H+ antiporter MnhA subunit